MVINKSQTYIYFHNISYDDSITLDSHFDCILCGRRFFFKFIYFQKLKKQLNKVGISSTNVIISGVARFTKLVGQNLNIFQQIKYFWANFKKIILKRANLQFLAGVFVPNALL